MDFRGGQRAPVDDVWVLAELADAFCGRRTRHLAAEFISSLDYRHDIDVIPFDAELFDAGLSLYESRPDKDWSLTDCISFVVMERQGVSEALTGDRHFSQVGFRLLLT
ncbi:MAG: hypothetical protein M3552_10255 [Planctomycetota bacterium]|nr:hypothetical protein [Planctomycetota bacterium]